MHRPRTRTAIAFHLWLAVAIACTTWAAARQAKPDGAGAPPAVPKSPKAVAAQRKYEKSVSAARDAYAKALVAADRQLMTDLDVALKAALKAGSLEEANALNAAVTDAKARLKKHQAGSVSGDIRVFVVDTKADWQNTMPVRKGQKIIISASGTASYDIYQKLTAGPEGKPEGAYLEARVGDGGEPVRVGAGAILTATRSGMLQFQTRDPFRNDNDGVFTVLIESAGP